MYSSWTIIDLVLSNVNLYDLVMSDVESFEKMDFELNIYASASQLVLQFLKFIFTLFNTILNIDHYINRTRFHYILIELS